MKFKNVSGDDRAIAGGIGLVKADEVFELPEDMPLASIAHQDIYEPADDETRAAVDALLAELADAGAADEQPADPETPVTDPPADPSNEPPVADPTDDSTSEQESN